MNAGNVATDIGGIGRLVFSLIALLAGLVVTEVAGAAEGGRYEVPPSIDRTGSADVTDELLDFFASVPDGSTIVFGARARHRVEGTLVLSGRQLSFEGNGAEIFATVPGDRGRRHFWFRGGGPIAVRDLVVKGANPHAGTSDAAWDPDREAQHGFDFESVNGVILERVQVTDVYGDFVYLGGRWFGNGDQKRFVWTRDVVIRDSRFERNGRQGLTINAAEDVLIEHNYVGDVRRSMFDIEPNSDAWGARRVRIAYNDFGPARLNFVAGRGAGGIVEDIEIVHNTLAGKAMRMDLRGHPDARRGPITIAHNTSTRTFSSSRALIELYYFDGITIVGNTQPFNADRTMTAVLLRYSCVSSIHDNNFTGATTPVDSDSHACPEVQPPPPAPPQANPAPAPTVPDASNEPPPRPPAAPAAEPSTPVGNGDAQTAPAPAPTSGPAPTKERPVGPDVTQTLTPSVSTEQEALGETTHSRNASPSPAIPTGFAFILVLIMVALEVRFGLRRLLGASTRAAEPGSSEKRGSEIDR